MDKAKAIKKALEKIGNIPVKAISDDNICRGIEIIKKYGDMPISKFQSPTFKDELNNAFPVINDELDCSFLLELLYHFPISQTFISTGSYDQYLFDLEKTVIDNYVAGNFQVSFFYAHLIFMSYVYYCVEKAYQLNPERMKDIFYPINSYHGKDDKPDIENLGNVYEFSKIPEKDIFKVFHVMGMDDTTIKAFSRYISSRDDFAHATGKGNISEQDFRDNIRTVIGNMKSLQGLFLPNLKKLYSDFMIDRIDADYDVVIDNFNDFVFDNELSIADLDYLCHLSIRTIQDSRKKLKEEFQSTRNIHCAFIEYCMENDGIEPPAGYPSLQNEKYLFYRYKNHADDYNFCKNCGKVKPVGEPVCGDCLNYAKEKIEEE